MGPESTLPAARSAASRTVPRHGGAGAARLRSDCPGRVAYEKYGVLARADNVILVCQGSAATPRGGLPRRPEESTRDGFGRPRSRPHGGKGRGCGGMIGRARRCTTLFVLTTARRLRGTTGPSSINPRPAAVRFRLPVITVADVVAPSGRPGAFGHRAAPSWPVVARWMQAWDGDLFLIRSTRSCRSQHARVAPQGVAWNAIARRPSKRTGGGVAYYGPARTTRQGVARWSAITYLSARRWATRSVARQSHDIRKRSPNGIRG